MRLPVTDARNPAQRNRLLELVVIVILILIFITVAIHQILRLRVAAERVAVMQMVGSLRTAISIELMHLVLHGTPADIAAMNHADPMLYLQQLPPNFEVLKKPVPPAQLQPYRWYYEPKSGILIYRVGNAEYLDTPLPSPPRIRFQLQVRYKDVNGNHHYDPGIDGLQGVDLVALEPYKWLPGP